MKYSSIGVSGLDVLFMSDSEREVFYQRIPLFTPKELQTIITTIKLNQKAIEKLNLRKDPKTREFSDVLSSVRQYKERFFKTEKTPVIVDKTDEIEVFNGLTSEFSSMGSTEDDVESLFEKLAEDIAEEITPLEEVEIFIRCKGTSKDTRHNVDIRVMENNFLSILNKYNEIPADISILPDNPIYKDKYVTNAIRALSKRVSKSELILQQMRQEHKNTLVDVTIHGRVGSTSRRISIYKRFSERRKTVEDVRYTLSQITRQLHNVPSDDLSYIDSDGEFDTLLEQYGEEIGITKGNAEERQVVQLVPLFLVIKSIQILEYKEIFNKLDPTREEVIKCSQTLASALSITGLIPSQEEILVQSIPALNLKPMAPPLSAETIFVLDILAMSLVSEKYGMITEVYNR